MSKTATGVTPLTISTLRVGSMQTNCYLISETNSRETIIVDPGDDAEFIIGKLEHARAKPQSIIATHGHFDHIMAAYELEVTYSIPFLIHQRDVFLVKRMGESAKHFLKLASIDPPPNVTATLAGGDQVNLGGFKLLVKETPGHTPGSISLYIKEAAVLLVGDLLFAGGGAGRGC